MTWTRMTRQPRLADRGAVEIGCSAKGPRLQGGINVVLRAAKLPAFSFLRPGGCVDVLLGSGENSGKLRIEGGSEFKLFCLGRSATNGTVMLRGLPMPDGMTARDHAAQHVVFETGEDWIEIQLPRWPTEVAPQPAPPAAPASPAAPARHSSIMERVPDPAARLRGAAR